MVAPSPLAPPVTPLRWSVLAATLALAALAPRLSGCASDTPREGAAGGGGAGGKVAVEEGPAWTPGTRYPTPREANARGFLDRRGLIHAHSIYSHDACDGEPHDEKGQYNQACLDEFRAGLCATQMDFVMATDHRDSFARVEFPGVLLHRPDAGDTLIERQGRPVANRIACAGRDPVVMMAGTESGTMPVGLEQHVAGDAAQRYDAYGGKDAATMELYRSLGAVNLVAHTENYTADELVSLPLDGFEMFNLHANAYNGAGALVKILQLLKNQDPGLPHPDLVIVPVYSEDTVYLERWGSVLARGARRATTMGTHCHRNSFPQLLPDGERIDSYRRMMGWFSNHLLVRPGDGGAWDDASLKEALRSARLYGVFEMLGVPVGFDYHATSAGAEHEMGDQVSLAAGVTLKVTLPRVSHLDPAVEAPRLTARLLRAQEGGWEVVASATESLAFSPTVAGAYRAEIRMQPRHLRAHLGAYADTTGQADLIWIYANAIHVVP